MRSLVSLLAILWMFAAANWAQDAQDTRTAYCDYEDGSQVTMHYNPVVKDEPRNGRIWSPGITLFAQVPLRLGSSEIPIGAYTVHIIPDKKNWTLIVNKDVTAGSTYNSAQDIARALMEMGEIPEPTKRLELSFAREGSKQCGLRVYYAKVGAFTEFKEK
jgi:Protein of unknown function (DUF2911)